MKQERNSKKIFSSSVIVLTFIISFIFLATTIPSFGFVLPSDLTIGSYKKLVGIHKVGQNVYDYTYNAKITNNGTTAVKYAKATLRSLVSTTQVIDGSLTFRDIPAGGTVQSRETFKVRIDSGFSFNESDLAWDIDYEIEGDQVYAAINPRALPPPVQLVPLSPRLANLSGKVVYVVNEPGAEATLFLSRVVDSLPGYFSGMDVRYRQKKGFFSDDDPALWNEIDANGDAVIYGVAGHGSGASWGSHWVAGLEKRGIPGVYIVGEPFVEDAVGTATREGMPSLRMVLVPHPCMYIPIGDMPPIMEKIIEALTVPLTAEEQKTGIYQVTPPPRIAIKGTMEEIQKYFYEKGWTDGLPIIIPTEEKVAEMLKGTSHAPDEIVEYPHPEKFTATVEKVAINGVMAGCKPEYMPVLLALTEAFSKGPYVSSVRSTNSFTFMSIVNGPIRTEIGMNAGVGAMSPGNQANASIGRFLNFVMYNLGGGRVGVNLMGSQGNTTGYSFCFPENEEMMSSWKPFHVLKGYKPSDSTVTVFRGGFGHAGNTYRIDTVVNNLLNLSYQTGALVLVDPLVIGKYKLENGLNTKEAVEEYLLTHTSITVAEAKALGLWSNMASCASGKQCFSMYGTYWWPPEILNFTDNDLVTLFPRSQFHVVVVGGATNAYVTSWSHAYDSTVSVDKWR